MDNNENTPPPEITESPSQALPHPGIACAWLLLMAAIFVISAVLFFTLYGVYIGLQNNNFNQELLQSESEAFALKPLAMSILYFVQFCLLMPLILLISHFREQHWQRTLAFNPVTRKTLGFWFLVFALYQAAATLINELLHIPIDPFMKAINGSKHWGLAIIIVVFAPLLEEMLFRGYLYKAWRSTRLGASGTILLTGILFTLLHAGQYNIYVMLQLFVLAIILGIAREKTGSLWVPIMIHAANNLLAAVMIVFLGLLEV